MPKVTNIQVSPQKDEEPLLAFVSFALEDAVVVRGCMLIRKPDGKSCFVAMPARKRSDGSAQDIVVVIDRAFRDELDARVIAEYERIVAEEES